MQTTIEDQRKMRFDAVDVASMMLEVAEPKKVLQAMYDLNYYLDDVLMDWIDNEIIDDEDYQIYFNQYLDRIAYP